MVTGQLAGVNMSLKLVSSRASLNKSTPAQQIFQKQDKLAVLKKDVI